jgi:hypothetical protein
LYFRNNSLHTRNIYIYIYIQLSRIFTVAEGCLEDRRRTEYKMHVLIFVNFFWKFELSKKYSPSCYHNFTEVNMYIIGVSWRIFNALWIFYLYFSKRLTVAFLNFESALKTTCKSTEALRKFLPSYGRITWCHHTICLFQTAIHAVLWLKRIFWMIFPNTMLKVDHWEFHWSFVC